MIIEIRKTKTGNCRCAMCGKIQDGNKLHPITVWYKGNETKRGVNNPVCSMECAKRFTDYLNNL